MLARNVSAEGRSRAFVGGRLGPVSVLAEVAEPLVAVHGQSDQHRLLQPRAQREALDRFGGRRGRRRCSRLRRPPRAAARHRARARRGRRHRPRPGPRGRPAPVRARRDRGGRPRAGRGRRPGGRGGAAGPRRHAAHRRRAGARGASPSDQDQPDALATTSAARTLLDGVRDHDPEAGELADRLAELSYLLSDLAADVASYASRLETDPARLATVSERRAALTALTRKYGETIDEVLAWAEQSAARLLELDDTDDRIEELRAERARPARASSAPPPRRCPRPAPPPRRGCRTRSPPS